jgi:hypothetical protein
MARIDLSGRQIPTLSKLNIDGQLTLDAQSGTTGQILTSAGAGNTPTWTSSLSSITNITGAASNNMTIQSASSGNGNLNLYSSGTGRLLLYASNGRIALGGEYTTRAAGSTSILGNLDAGTSTGGHVYIQSAYAGYAGTPGNIYIDAQYDEQESRGQIYIGTGVDGQLSSAEGITIGNTINSTFLNSGNIYLNGNISGSIKVTGGNAGTSGQVLTSAGAGATPTWSNPAGFAGGTLTSGLVLAAGTTSLTPLRFTSGTNLTTLTAGAIEYDGSVLYATPKVNNSTAGRGVIPAQMYFSPLSQRNAISTSTAGTNTGNAFGKSIYLAASTAYKVEGFVIIQTNYTVSAASGLGAFITVPSGTTSGIFATNGSTGATATTSTSTNLTFNLNSSSTQMQASFGASGLYNRMYFSGILKTSTTAGNFALNLQVVSAAVPATTTVIVHPGSFISVTPISGAAGSDINIGGWA